MTYTETLKQRLATARPDIFAVNNKFAPKHSFAARCILYGYWKLGVTVPVLAQAFDLNRGTVRYITAPSSRYYKNVRKEWIDLGEDAFHKAYTGSPDGEDWAKKIEASKKSAMAALPEDLLRDVKADAVTVADRKAKQKEGKHTITNGIGKTFIATVMWFDTIPKGFEEDEDTKPRLPGWYCAVSGKGEDPIVGLSAGRFTSTQALKSLLALVEGTLAS